MSPRSFAIDITWAQQVPELTDSGLSATFAELTLRCADETVTRHVDGLSVFPHVFVPLAPVATWFARCWPDLLGNHPPFPMRDSSDAQRALAQLDEEDWSEAEPDIDRWLRGHALRFVGDGLLLPDLVLWRRDDRMSLSWRPWRPAEGTEFLGEGHLEVPVQAFVDEIRTFIELVQQRLAGAGESSAARIELERAAARVNAPWSDAGLSLVARRLGRTVDDLRRWLGPKRTAEEIRERLAEAYGVAEDDLADPIFIDSPMAMAARSAGPCFSTGDHDRILRLGRKLLTSPPRGELAAVRARLAPERVVAFPRAADGYRRADAVRRLLGKGRRLEVGDLLERWCAIVDEPFDDASTDGIVLWTRDQRVLIAANTRSPRTSTRWGRRAMLAHELYHLLYDAGDDRFFGEVTSDAAQTSSEPAANAFAAELLLPSKYLPKDIARFWTDLGAARAAVSTLCEDFEVGWELAVRQLQNHRQLPNAVVEALLNEPRRTPN